MARRAYALVGVTTALIVGNFLMTVGAQTIDAKSFMKMVNTNADVDKTISLEELDTFAKKRFAEIESDKDQTLDQKELKGRLSKAGMAKADMDADKTIDEKEFIDYANKLFAEANVKKKPGKAEPTLSEAELKTSAGRKLMTMLR